MYIYIYTSGTILSITKTMRTFQYSMHCAIFSAINSIINNFDTCTYNARIRANEDMHTYARMYTFVQVNACISVRIRTYTRGHAQDVIEKLVLHAIKLHGSRISHGWQNILLPCHRSHIQGRPHWANLRVIEVLLNISKQSHEERYFSRGCYTSEQF